MAAPTEVLHDDGAIFVEAETLIGEPRVWFSVQGRNSANLTPAKARELAAALTAHAEQAERLLPMKASATMRNTLIRAAIKQAPRRFDGSYLTGFGVL
jgi:hypothetical protein